MATVFRELVRAGGDVHLEWCEVGQQLAGSYSSAAGMLQACVLLEVLEAESKLLTLNPPDPLQQGDRLVALTRQGEEQPETEFSLPCCQPCRCQPAPNLPLQSYLSSLCYLPGA